MDENIKNTTIKPKKKRLTKVVFYIMSILLLSTTCMCGYMTYTLYNITTTSSSTSSNNTENETETKENKEEPSTEANNDSNTDNNNENVNKEHDELLANIKSELENGTSTLRIIRSLYPEHLVYGDSGKYVFKDINKNLLMNSFKKDNFKIELDENDIPTTVEYYENENDIDHCRQ